MFVKTLQFHKFCAYGFLKNLRIFDVFFLLFLRDAGLSYLQIGSLYSIRQIVINLLEIPSGLAADVIGRKTILIFGMLFYIASFLTFYFSNGFSSFAIAIILFGIAEACRSGTHKAMIMGYLQKNNLVVYKTQFYGATRSWSQFGSAISSLLAMTVLLIHNDYRILFLLSAIPYTVNAIVLWTYPSYLNLPQGKADRQSGRILNVFKETASDFFRMFKDLQILRTIFSAASFIAVYKSLKDYLQPLLKSLAISLPLLTMVERENRAAIIIGVVYFLIFLMTSFTSRNAWRVEARLKNLPGAINITYLIGVGSILLSGFLVWQNLPFLAALVFIGLYLIQNVRRPLSFSYLSEKIDSKILASGLSVESQMETILVALAAPLLGFLVDTIDLGVGLGVIAIIFLLIYPLVRLKIHE